MVIVELKALSMGRIWSTNSQGRRYLTNEGKRFKYYVGQVGKKEFSNLINYKLEIKFRAIFHGNWYRKDGAISKTAGDLDNFNKLILDGLSEALDFNDAQIFDIHISKSKEKAEIPYFEFEISAL